MKRLSLIAMMCLIGLFSSYAQTQMEVTVGEGTKTQQVIPNHEYWNYSVSHQIYTAEEMIGVVGTISKVAFKQANESTYTRNISIYMLNTDKESLVPVNDSLSVLSM